MKYGKVNLKSLELLLIVFLSMVFIVSGANKLFNMYKFVESLTNYKILPFEFLYMFSFSIALCEFWIGVGILIKGWREIALIAGSLMLFLFTIFVLVEYINGSKSACGCGVPLISSFVEN